MFQQAVTSFREPICSNVDWVGSRVKQFFDLSPQISSSDPMRTNARAVMLAIAVLCVAFARAHAQSSSPAIRPVDSSPVMLLLRAGDAVRVEVSDEPSLAGEFVIGGDGHVLLPMIGLVRVANRDFAEVTAELRAAYGRQFKNVTVRFTPLLRIAVLGEVRTPGLYLIDRTYSLTDLLARAGGLTPTANTDRITIVRADGEQVARLKAVATITAPFNSGDQIRVDRRGWLSENLGIVVGATASLAVALMTGVLLR